MCVDCVRTASNVLATAPGLHLGPGGAADLLAAVQRDIDDRIAWGILGDEAHNLREGCTTPASAIRRASAGQLCWLLCKEGSC